MKTLIYLVRHGESLGNAKRIYLGHTNLDLSELGYEQANITAEYLKDVKIDAVYSSDLLRAHNTAVPHAALRNLTVNDSTKLREIFLGDWEGAEVDMLIKDHYDDFVIGWKENFGTFTVPGGESVQGAAQRMHDEVLRIAKENVGKTVLIASHAAVIRSMWGKISGVKPENLASETQFPTNASYTVIEYDGEKLLPIEFSHDSQFPNPVGL